MTKEDSQAPVNTVHITKEMGSLAGLVYGDSGEHSPLAPSCARVLENHLFALTKSPPTTQAWRGTKLMVP